MTKRLVKIAKELNVGTGTIVEYLNGNGYEIDNKPTAKVTEEMYAKLLKEFQKSKEIAIKANQMVIGGSRTQGEEEEASASKAGHGGGTGEKKVSLQARTAPEKAAGKPAEEDKPRVTLTGPRVVGKINLGGNRPTTPPAEEKAEEVAPAETPVEKEPAAEAEKPVAKAEPETEKESPAETPETEAPPAAESQPEEEATKAAEDQEETPAESADESAPTAEDGEEKPQKAKVVKAEAPELRGLKIVGKIDTDKLEKPKKKKKEEEAKESGDDSRRRRRRRRKRVQAPAKGRTGGQKGRGPGKKDEPKEVSQKEIEEKIKATMARISGTGGSKKKRQRLSRDKRERHREQEEARIAEQESGTLQLTEFISVQDLANLMDVPVTDVITTCMNLGVIVSINQRLDAEIIELVAEEFGHEVEFISVEEQDDEEEEIFDDPEDLEPRAPIVTVMGHVDHGKTSLLDYIREANVVSGEAGGITQHIGAYEVTLDGDESKSITFLDTPGHEAFTAMRARGAKVTDIAVIIIAADDNVMPQTREAISHAQAAGVPIVFAINKVDKPGADPDRIKQELASMNLLVEDWGGKIQSQDISALTGQGVPELLEKIVLEAELLELQANPDREAHGAVLEASLDKGRGYVTKVLVQTGTLNIGDPIVSGEFSGKVKAMFNERGKRVKAAGPSKPVLVLGLDGAPQAGERFKEMESEQAARQIASRRSQISREQANRATKRISLDEIGRRLALGSFQELNLIVKGDFDGSVEALSDSLIKLSVESIKVNVIHKAVGQIIESDVLLASASDAIIIGFQVRPSSGARHLAEKEGVEIKTYSIIYEAIEEVKMAMEGMLEPTREERILGEAEVRETYKISRVGTIAGCFVQDGKMSRNANVRLIRNGIVVYPAKEGQHGEVASLKRFKDDAKEVKNGLECGISIKNFNDIKVGDVIEAYEIVEIRQTLD